MNFENPFFESFFKGFNNDIFSFLHKEAIEEAEESLKEEKEFLTEDEYQIALQKEVAIIEKEKKSEQFNNKDIYIHDYDHHTNHIDRICGYMSSSPLDKCLREGLHD